jgi:ribosomal protein S21
MGKAVNVSVEADSKSVRSIDENDRLIRKFSKKVKKSGLMDELRERRYFTKKSAKRKLKREKKLRLSKECTAKKNKFK